MCPFTVSYTVITLLYGINSGLRHASGRLLDAFPLLVALLSPSFSFRFLLRPGGRTRRVTRGARPALVQRFHNKMTKEKRSHLTNCKGGYRRPMPE